MSILLKVSHLLHCKRLLILLALWLAFGLACRALPSQNIPSPSGETAPVLVTPTPFARGGSSSAIDGAVIPTQTAPAKESFSSRQAYDHVLYLSNTIGSRPTGTEKERAAAGYIFDKLESYGYRVEKQTFSFPYFSDKGSRLEIIEPRPERLQPNTLYFSPPGELQGQLVFAGIGRPQDFPSAGLGGKVALMERGIIPFRDKVINAAAAGASAALIYNDREGNFRGSLGSLGPIPTVSLPQAQGQHLRALLDQSPVTIDLMVESKIETIESANILALSDVPCRVIVGAHYDSVEAGPGANDNASGVTTVLEVARVVEEEVRKRGPCFVAFGAEELGLFGSRHYVETLTPWERLRILGMINLDMVGVGEEWQLVGDARLVDLGIAVAREQGLVVTKASLPEGTDSDHTSFAAVGIPAVLLIRFDDPNYHTARDRAEFVAPELLAEAGRIALGMVERLIEGRR